MGSKGPSPLAGAGGARLAVLPPPGLEERRDYTVQRADLDLGQVGVLEEVAEVADHGLNLRS